jgi:diguanylate cyclase (GGDEF)-like protein
VYKEPLLSKSDAFNQSLLDFKQQLARKLMAGFTIFCTVGLPISLSRWPEITVIAYGCLFRPNKTNYKFDFIIIILLLTSMIVSGTFSFGLQAGTITFAVFCTFLIALTWGFLAALAYAVCWCAYIITLGYLFSNLYLEYTISPNEYGITIGAWILVALGSSLIIILMLITAKQGYRHFCGLIDEIEQQKTEIEHLANIDIMTGFFNNRLAMPLLSQSINLAQREHSKVGVVFIDLNDFKKINDSYGHDAGDFVLKETARRMRAVLRDMDVTCRIGGDEFLFIIPKVNDVEEIKVVLKRVIDTWSEPILYKKIAIFVKGSIGVAMFPKDANSAEELRQKADVAMYFAKANGIALNFFV